MKHLKHSAIRPLDFIDQIIASRRARDDDKSIIEERAECKVAGNPIPPVKTYKERCDDIRHRNETEINKYELAFNADDLIEVSKGVPVPLNGSEKDCRDMESLYSFSCVQMDELWTEVLSSEGYLNDLCPVCESMKATTFDHYLPKSEYQLFAVHPLNLIPCCIVCNGHKSKGLFDDNGKRKFWNAYLDEEIEEQYLFCDIIEEKEMPMAEFRVEQGALPDRYFEIVKQSFDEMELDDNYRGSCGREIVRLKNICCIFFIKNQDKGLDACLQAAADTISDTKANYWVNVLYKSLIVTEVFKLFVMKALNQDYGIQIGE